MGGSLVQGGASQFFRASSVITTGRVVVITDSPNRKGSSTMKRLKRLPSNLSDVYEIEGFEVGKDQVELTLVTCEGTYTFSTTRTAATKTLDAIEQAKQTQQ